MSLRFMASSFARRGDIACCANNTGKYHPSVLANDNKNHDTNIYLWTFQLRAKRQEQTRLAIASGERAKIDSFPDHEIVYQSHPKKSSMYPLTLTKSELATYLKNDRLAVRETPLHINSVDSLAPPFTTPYQNKLQGVRAQSICSSWLIGIQVWTLAPKREEKEGNKSLAKSSCFPSAQVRAALFHRTQ